MTDGIRIAAMPDLGAVSDASSVVGELSGSGRFTAPALRSYVQTGRHGVLRPSGGDDTAALQAAITANLFGTLELSSGIFIVSAPIVISGAITLMGSGVVNTTIRAVTNDQICFDVAAASPVAIEKMGIVPTGANVTGIRVDPVGAANTESTFRDLHILGCGICIDTQNAASWVIENCHFENYTVVGVNVRCTSNPDNGDSMITDCFFLSLPPTICVQQQSSGGLKISACKFLNATFGYYLALEAGAVTGILNITGCSFDGTINAIVLTQQGAGSSFHDAMISGCDFSQVTQAVTVTNSLGISGWILGVVVSGCLVYLNSGGIAFSIAGVNGFTIGDSQVYLPSGTGSVAIIAADASNGLIHPINRMGTLTTYVNNSGNNVKVEPKIQHGSVAVSTTTPLDTLFEGAGSPITFPYAYLGSAPVVIVTINGPGAAGAISGFATSVGLTSFVPNIIGLVNSASTGCTWAAYGDW